ncbi:MAG: hypothetical protein HY081_00270 [Gammaproteobacteria bacterium]|nr:hypothetical protein [Gammaproteobacteria bacterium]
MKMSKLLLVSLTTAGVMALAGQASAFAPVWPTDGDAADGADPVGSVVLWHAGASASTASVQTAVVSAYCDAAQAVDILEDARTVGKPAFWTVACIGKSTLPATLAGKKILWNKRDEGGSGVGVGPLALSTPIGFMKPSTGAGNNCPAVSSTRLITGTTITANIWNCTNFTYSLTPPVAASYGLNDADPAADAVARVPDIGTSDIEPDKFTSTFSFNVPKADFNLDGVINAADTLATYDATGLTKDSLAALTFGIPVNILMYQDLQREQFPTGHPLFSDCNPAGATYGTIASSASNANAEKCMPSLTGNEIRSVYMKGGAIRSSTDLQYETPFGSAAFTTLAATLNGATDNTIQICRRVNGSGTQAQFNAIMLGYPCDATFDGAIDSLQPEAAGPLATFVTENEGSGDVEKCLNDFNNGTNTTGQNSALRKRWAVGIQSMEKNAPSGAGAYTNAYRFIKVDGFAPTLANVHAGDYYDVAAQSLQYKTGAPAVTVDAYSSLKPEFQNPLNLPDLNKLQAFGTAGWMALPSATNTPDAVLNLARPVSWYRRVSFSGAGNTCALPSMFKKTGGSAATVGPQNWSSNGGADSNCYTP